MAVNKATPVLIAAITTIITWHLRIQHTAVTAASQRLLLEQQPLRSRFLWQRQVSNITSPPLLHNSNRLRFAQLLLGYRIHNRLAQRRIISAKCSSVKLRFWNCIDSKISSKNMNRNHFLFGFIEVLVDAYIYLFTSTFYFFFYYFVFFGFGFCFQWTRFYFLFCKKLLLRNGLRKNPFALFIFFHSVTQNEFCFVIIFESQNTKYSIVMITIFHFDFVLVDV